MVGLRLFLFFYLFISFPPFLGTGIEGYVLFSPDGVLVGDGGADKTWGGEVVEVEAELGEGA